MQSAMLITNDTIVPWSPYRVETFPSSKGKVMLGEALATYTILQSGIGPMQIAEAFDEVGDKRTRDTIASAVRFLGNLLLQEKFTTYARPIGGGEPARMPASMWELDDFTHRFATCALDPRRPFDDNAKATHRIFMGEDDLQTLIDVCCADIGSPAPVKRQHQPSIAQNEDKPIMPVNPVTTDRLIRLPEVEMLVGMKRSTIYSRISGGRFPDKVKSGSISMWREADIRAWLADPK